MAFEEPADQPYGDRRDRRYGARNPEGLHWYFATHRGKGPLVGIGILESLDVGQVLGPTGCSLVLEHRVS